MTNPLAFAINLYLNIERTDKKGFLGTRIFFGNTAPFAVRVEVTDTVTHQLVVSDVICQGVLALGTSSINTPEYQLGYDNDLPIAQSIMEWLSRHAAWGRAIKELMVHFSAYTSTNSYGLRNTRLDCDVLVGDYTDPGEKKKELFSTVIY